MKKLFAGITFPKKVFAGITFPEKVFAGIMFLDVSQITMVDHWIIGSLLDAEEGQQDEGGRIEDELMCEI